MLSCGELAPNEPVLNEEHAVTPPDIVQAAAAWLLTAAFVVLVADGVFVPE